MSSAVFHVSRALQVMRRDLTGSAVEKRSPTESDDSLAAGRDFDWRG